MEKYLIVYLLSLILSSQWLYGQVDSIRLMQTLQELCSDQMQGRKPETKGHDLARDFIESGFEAAGLKRIDGRYVQTGHMTSSPIKNVHGLHEGDTDRFILLTAHYDHLGKRKGDIYPGCDDNGSGVAAMLEVADQLVDRSLSHSFIFIAFDQEEYGLLGSKYWVENAPVALEQIALIVNLDMVSKNDKNELYAAGTHQFPHFRKPLDQIAQAYSMKLRFGHDQEQLGHDDWTYASDHGPFFQKGVPFLYFGVEDHSAYHQPTDTFDKTNFSFYYQVTQFLVEAMVALDKF